MDFLIERWKAVWTVKINEAPYSKHLPEALTEWCVENGIEFGYKKNKFIHFGTETDLTLFHLRWL